MCGIDTLTVYTQCVCIVLCCQCLSAWSREPVMTSSGLALRPVTASLLFLVLSIVTCRGDSPSWCTPDCCNYTASERLLDCSQLGCSRLVNFSSWTLPVETLSLRGNNLSCVTPLGSVCAFLRYLDVSDNVVADIDHAAFRGCENLSSIMLDRNRLKVDTFFDPAKNPLFGLGSLTRLSLTSNDVGDLVSEPFSAEIYTLQFLNLSANGIGAVERNSLTDLIHLRTLDLSSNLITQLHPQTFRGLRSLTYLSLGRNRLSWLPPDLLSGCRNLEELDLSENYISEVDRGAFGGLDSLKVLRLGANLLESIPEPLPTSLQHLYLDNSPKLESLGCLGPKLVSLSVSNSDHLTAIGPRSFSNTAQLGRILVTGNRRLATVSKYTFGGPNSSVTWLNLSYNALASLSEELVDWRSVSGGDLSGNAWNCDCHLEWIRRRNEQPLFHTVVLVTPLY